MKGDRIGAGGAGRHLLGACSLRGALGSGLPTEDLELQPLSSMPPLLGSLSKSTPRFPPHWESIRNGGLGGPNLGPGLQEVLTTCYSLFPCELLQEWGWVFFQVPGAWHWTWLVSPVWLCKW